MNPIRGEAEVEIGGETHTLTITMEALANVSRIFQGMTMAEAIQRLVGGEPNAISAVLKARDNASLAAAVKTLPDFMAVAGGCEKAIANMMGNDEGNAGGGTESQKA